MENEKKRLAQEFVDEVMSGKYPNIEIDENGCIDHYGSKYKLKILGGIIWVDYKPTIWFWICFIFILIAMVLFAQLMIGGVIAELMSPVMRKALEILCCSYVVISYSYLLFILSKQIQFQRYINSKFRRYNQK